MSTSVPLKKLTNYRTTLAVTRTLVYILLGILAIICILPFWVMIVNSTRTNNEILSGVTLLPGSHMIDNFKTLILGKMDLITGVRREGLNIPRGFLNSLFIALCATGLSGYVGALTGYAFALYNFRGKKILWGIILTVLMVPPTVGLIGYYKLVSGLNMIDTYWPLILPAAANPFAVFFLRNYISSSLSISLVEAARIDGAKELYVFNRIALPLAMPGIATISILGFLGSWNNYLLPLIVLNDKNLYTMPLQIQQLNTSLYNRDFGALYMGIALSVIPILAFFAFFSRYLIEGISAGSVKE